AGPPQSGPSATPLYPRRRRAARSSIMWGHGGRDAAGARLTHCSGREGPMIYMVEMDFPHPERLQEWHDWYLAHIRVLLTVPGVPAVPGGLAVSWLTGVGLDRTVERCGLAVLNDPAPVLDLARHEPRVRLYRPISEKIRAPA